MSSIEALSDIEDGEHLTEFPLLKELAHNVKETEPEKLEDKLLTKIRGNTAFDAEDVNVVEQTISVMKEVHEGQQRKYSYQPADIKKPFITHTLATALMVYEVMGEEVTADALAVALLHDAIEDGKITESGQPKKRNATKEDINKRLRERGIAGERITRITNAVEALSNVRDIKEAGQPVVRESLTKEQYFANIAAAHQADLKLGIVTIKACDRSTNLVDPFRKVRPEHGELYQRSHNGQDAPDAQETTIRKKDAYTSRRDHIENSQTHLYPLLSDDPKVSRYLHTVIDLADLTCQPRFIPGIWKTQFRLKQYVARQRAQRALNPVG